MSTATAYARYSDGCSVRCRPPSHDLLAHEQCGEERGYARGVAAAVSEQTERGYAIGYEACRAEQAERTVRTGTLVVELKARRVWVDGTEIALGEREWGVLAYLAERVGRRCDTDEIVASVWGPEWITDRRYGHYHGRQTVRLLGTTIHRLRRKLGPAARVLASGPYGWRYLIQEPPEVAA